MYPVYDNIITVTPTIDTNAYGTGDQVGPAATKLTGTFLRSGLTRLQSILITDASKQKAAIDLFFWNQLPTVTSVDNGAFALSTAELIAKCMGIISVVAGDYKDTSGQTVATQKNLNYLMKGSKGTTNPEGRDAWVTIVSRGTPTYATATALQLTFLFQ